jgi:pSer/pThr/pTyr-binding forkhead associated (FHA) protein
MSGITLRVLDGADRGRVFQNLPLPITIGREEGNAIQLNDERVSRYHAKVQFDNGEFILTDHPHAFIIAPICNALRS